MNSHKNAESTDSHKSCRLSTRKGQMFIIGAIVVIIGVVMIKGLFLSYSGTLTNDDSYKGFLLNNLKVEYERAASISYLSGSNIVDDFSNYLTQRVDMGILYVYSKRDDTGSYVVNIGNYLGYNITVSVAGFNQNLDDGQNEETTLSLNDVDFVYGSRSVSLNLNADALLFYSVDLGDVVREREYRID